ncbi:MAG: Pvc16 family protein [Rhodanobacter sp.]
MPELSRIAAVSGQLHEHLLGAFAAPDWSGAVPTLSDSPGEDPSTEHGRCTLIVLLYHVAYNDEQRNVRPLRPFGATGVGERLAMTLDLHYLVAAAAAQSFQAQALLERACLRMHQAPIISASDTGQQEPLRFVPVARLPEELLALWQGFGMAFRPSLAYRVAASIDRSDGGVSPLPVLQWPPV